MEIAERHNLIVVEDACQAHGAEYFSARSNRWMKAGSIGSAAAFSFYPGKNLGACGEAGAITTNDEEIARKCRMIRDHGQAKKYYHDVEGYNGRLDAIQAAFLRIKLKHLPKSNEQRRNRAQVYGNLLTGSKGAIVPLAAPWAKAVYHLYVIRVEDRDDLMTKLAAENIGIGIHYPIPLHLQKAYGTWDIKKATSRFRRTCQRDRVAAHVSHTYRGTAASGLRQNQTDPHPNRQPARAARPC